MKKTIKVVNNPPLDSKVGYKLKPYVPPAIKTVEPEVLLGEGGPSEAGWHQIESFLRCPKAYQFQHIRKVRKPLVQNPDHFSVGTLFHAARARWFSLRFATDAKAEASIEEAVRLEAERQELPVTAKAINQTLLWFKEFTDHWAKRPRPSPIAAEYLIGPAPLIQGDQFMFWRTAKLDDVSRYPEAAGKLCIGESKTTSDSVADCVNQYTMHGQPMLQVLLWKMSKQGEAKYGPVAGVMLDVIVKGYSGQRCKFARQFLPVTDHALNWFAKNLRAYLRASASVDWNADAPRNPNGCTFKAGKSRVACDYRDLCMHGRSASIKYVLEDGSSLLTWKKDAEHEVPPWE